MCPFHRKPGCFGARDWQSVGKPGKSHFLVDHRQPCRSHGHKPHCLPKSDGLGASLHKLGCPMWGRTLHPEGELCVLRSLPTVGRHTRGGVYGDITLVCFTYWLSSLFVAGPFRCCISSWVTLGGLCVSRNFSIWSKFINFVGIRLSWAFPCESYFISVRSVLILLYRCWSQLKFQLI